jgi:hypothetical protein
LKSRRRVPGEDHPKTLTSARDLALDLQTLGEEGDDLGTVANALAITQMRQHPGKLKSPEAR